MATPIVSGIAALLRTKFVDKIPSPPFIMGQLAVGGVGGGSHIGANEIIDTSRVLTEAQTGTEVPRPLGIRYGNTSSRQR